MESDKNSVNNAIGILDMLNINEKNFELLKNYVIIVIINVENKNR